MSAFLRSGQRPLEAAACVDGQGMNGGNDFALYLFMTLLLCLCNCVTVVSIHAYYDPALIFRRMVLIPPLVEGYVCCFDCHFLRY